MQTINIGDFVRVQACKTPGHETPSYCGTVTFVSDIDSKGRYLYTVQSKQARNGSCGTEWAHHLSVIVKAEPCKL